MIKIAVGLGENENSLLASKIASKNQDLEIKIAKTDEELISSIKDENVDGIVRGSLSSSKILKTIKELNKKSAILRASYIKKNKNKEDNENSKDHYEFLLGPVGIDEGNSITEKIELAIQSIKFMNSLNKSGKIAILAGGRKEDFGRNDKIDASIKESEKIAIELEKKLSKTEFKYSVKNYYILIEKAINEKNNIIIAPDGISGNLIFRTLVLLNSWPSYGAITFGMKKIFIDTSRDQSIDGYLRAINLAYKLAKAKSKK